MVTDFAKKASHFTSYKSSTILEQLKETNMLGHHSHVSGTSCPFSDVIDKHIRDKINLTKDISDCPQPKTCDFYSNAASYFIAAVLLKEEHKRHFEEESTVGDGQGVVIDAEKDS